MLKKVGLVVGVAAGFMLMGAPAFAAPSKNPPISGGLNFGNNSVAASINSNGNTTVNVGVEGPLGEVLGEVVSILELG